MPAGSLSCSLTSFSNPLQPRDDHAFLIYSGTNDRAVYALGRVIVRVGATLAIVARGANDKILSGSLARHVISVRENDTLTIEHLLAEVADLRRKLRVARVTIVPISEYFNAFLLANREVLEAGNECNIPLVDARLYRTLSDKESSGEFFSSRGFNVPRRYRGGDAAVPFVAKPRENVVDGRSLYPILVETEAERASFEAAPDADRYFLQEFVRGRSYYLLGYFASDGRKYVSSQENLAQQPFGKSIVLARTSDFHTRDVAARAIGVLEETGFVGFVMMEFIVSNDTAYFIELNPRPWCRINLCADHSCGIIEAFVGDLVHRDSSRYPQVGRSRRTNAWYAWSSGAIQSLRRHGRVDHRVAGAWRTFGWFLRALPGDVYLRGDSWRVFLREIFE